MRAHACLHLTTGLDWPEINESAALVLAHSCLSDSDYPDLRVLTIAYHTVFPTCRYQREGTSTTDRNIIEQWLQTELLA